MVVRPPGEGELATQPNTGPHAAGKAKIPPGANDTAKQTQREKAEVKEVAGRHKNDGQNSHTGQKGQR